MPLSGGKMSQKQQDEYNDAAFKAYNETALAKCDMCGRTFLPDRLAVHAKSCKGPSNRPGNSVAQTPNINSSSKMSPVKTGSGNTVDCSICGKPYAQKLIDYHMKRCSANTGAKQGLGLSPSPPSYKKSSSKFQAAASASLK